MSEETKPAKQKVVHDGLTERQRRFVDAWLGQHLGNGTRSAQAAGYRGSDNVLAQQAHYLLRSPKIRAAIDARIESDPLIVSRVERLRLLSRMARGEVKITESKLDAMGNAHEVEVETPVRDRIKALEVLGDLQDEPSPKRVELTGVNGQPLEQNVTVRAPVVILPAKDPLPE